MTGKTAPLAVLPALPDAEFISRDTMMGVLEELIVSGSWPAGAKMPSERELVGHFQLSRPVVREVLRGLEERGYITVRPARGSFVRELTASDAARPLDTLFRRTRVTARQLVVARTMLECEAAALAAKNADEEAKARSQAILEALRSADDLEHRAQLDLAFHESIARGSGNPVIHIMFSSIRPLVLGLVVRSLSDRKVRRVGEPLHDTILEAILASDPEAARAAMLEHLTLALRHYGDDLDRPLTEVLAQRAEATAQVADVLRSLGDLDLVPSPTTGRRRRSGR
jgi:GntR family transcriptional repressor for pyruvate dehydrogenase complex